MKDAIFRRHIWSNFTVSLATYHKMRSVREIITACQRSCRKVMFSQVSVILFLGKGSVPCDHDRYPPPRHGTWHLNPFHFHDTDIWWSLLETCSHLFTSGSIPPYWHLVVTTETRMVAKHEVSILLESCLVEIGLGFFCRKPHPYRWSYCFFFSTFFERSLLLLACNNDTLSHPSWQTEAPLSAIGNNFC